MPGLILLDPSFPPSSIPPTHKRQRLRLLTTYPIPLTVGGHQSEARSRSARSLVGCFPVSPPVDPFLSFSLRSSLDISALVKTRLLAVGAAAAQMQLFLPSSFCLLNYRRRVGLDWNGGGKGRAVFFATSRIAVRFREHPFVRASERAFFV